MSASTIVLHLPALGAGAGERTGGLATRYLGPKFQQGDRQAPEGFYTITPDLMNPNSSAYLAINTGFPNAYDQANGRTGQFLMIHGDCSSAGCYAMTDEQIAGIYTLAREAFFGGQRSFQVQAYPFRMTPLNMARNRNSPHMAFWRMLKQGYDHFETRQSRCYCSRASLINLMTTFVHVCTHLLANGDFVTALAKSLARRFTLKVLPVDLPDRAWPVVIITLKNRTLSPVVELFIERARHFTRSVCGAANSEAIDEYEPSLSRCATSKPAVGFAISNGTLTAPGTNAKY